MAQPDLPSFLISNHPIFPLGSCGFFGEFFLARLASPIFPLLALPPLPPPPTLSPPNSSLSRHHHHHLHLIMDTTTRQRRVVTASPPSTAANSALASPDDSPAASASSTSLSSLGSVDDVPKPPVKAPSSKLFDTYGNEFTIPDYTIKDIRDAIPKHCFERSAARGLYYVARDLVSLAATFVVFHKYCTPELVPSYPLRFALWSLYTVLQGLFGTGLWVLAHECGHQSFSPSKTLNDTVGWVCHSILLVPYFSWKISHGKHHKATGNMARDMVFVPRTREQHASRLGCFMHEMNELVEETPLYTAIHMLAQQLGGWQSYLILNATGHVHHDRQPEGKGVGRKNGNGSVNHFDPKSPLFERKDEHLILLSDLGLLIVGATLFVLGQKYGWANIGVWYFVPYLWVHHWLGESSESPPPP